jgi:hypothetical protein
MFLNFLGGGVLKNDTDCLKGEGGGAQWSEI